MADITKLFNVRPDGAWIRCSHCSRAYWGSFRPTDWILPRLTRHVRKAHPALAPNAPAPEKIARKAPRKAVDPDRANGPVLVIPAPAEDALVAQAAADLAQDAPEGAMQAALDDIARELAA
jgi:hypothetical protein